MLLMRSRHTIAFAWLMTALVSIAVPASAETDGDTAADAAVPESFRSRSGTYLVSYESELRPPVINRIHSWTIFIEDADGNPVTGARLSMTGGMPIHNHGLPTDPRMTRELGDGRYLFEGVRFHMNGAWELNLTIETDEASDVVVIPLTL
jgi:hypothetical protein